MSMNLPRLVSFTKEEDWKQIFFSENANWIVPGMVMVGGTPSMARSVTDRIRTLQVQGGVTTFVCLQAEIYPQVDDSSIVHFGGFEDGNEAGKLPSYAEAARQIDNMEEPKFVYYGIRDFEEAQSITQLATLVDDLARRVKNGEVIYIHCKGGFGRSGLVGACLLGCLYPELKTDEVLERIYKSCTMRWKGQQKCIPSHVKSPETAGQCKQVGEYLALIKKEATISL